MTNQQTIINTLHAKPTINPQQEIRKRINFLKNFLQKSNTTGYILGISGGQDSLLAGTLAQQAINELNKENNTNKYTFWAIRLPYGTQKDEQDAQQAINFIKPNQTRTINIKTTVDALQNTYNNMENTTNLTDYHKGNIKARARMIAQYAIAGQENLLVVGSDNLPEKLSGFFTKHGDGAADVLPLSGLNKRQEKQILKELGAPENLYTKAPTADLLDNVVGQPDETELGVTYDVIDDYLEGKEVSEEDKRQIEDRYLRTEHKRHEPVEIFDTWWK